MTGQVDDMIFVPEPRLISSPGRQEYLRDFPGELGNNTCKVPNLNPGTSRVRYEFPSSGMTRFQVSAP